MVLVGDHLYGGHGHNNGFPICVEFETGEVVWDEVRGPGEGSAAVVYADGNLYFHYQNGVMALIEATPEGYHERGAFPVPDAAQPCWAHPVVSGGKLYLREQDQLLCYELTR
jgi:outer membrane protein assembly factor BamB